jgi:hypothetical protein
MSKIAWASLAVVAAILVVGPILAVYGQGDTAPGEKAPPPKGERKWAGKGEGRPEPPPLTEEQKETLKAPTQAFLAALEAFQTEAIKTLGPQGGRAYVMRTVGRIMREIGPPRPDGEKGPPPPKGERKGRGEGKKGRGDAGGGPGIE